MAESVKNIYAEAVFELCEERGITAAACEELEAVGEVFDQNPDFVRLLRSPLVDMDEKKQLLEKVFAGQLSDTVSDFLCVATEKGRADCVPDICREFKALYHKQQNILEVYVTTAMPMSERLEQKLKDKLALTLGKTVIMHTAVDKALIGGIVVKYDNTELDSSVRGKLDRLKAQIDGIIA
ncbi:MAG: F0F1 ATP synthase subunit delta [Ruminococcus sp.]|nr:F0F1 ATP synthase subunit delta [Ruminococcus sp.]